MVTGTSTYDFTLSQILNKSTKISKNQNKPTEGPNHNYILVGNFIIAGKWTGVISLHLYPYLKGQCSDRNRYIILVNQSFHFMQSNYVYSSMWLP